MYGHIKSNEVISSENSAFICLSLGDICSVSSFGSASFSSQAYGEVHQIVNFSHYQIWIY